MVLKGRLPSSGANLKIIYDKSCREEAGAFKALSNIASDLEDEYLIVANDNIFTDDLRVLVMKYRAHNATILKNTYFWMRSRDS
ncbi:MAG: hypothetical protein QXP57_08665 [Nitrososphaerota archaeon]